MAEFGSLNLEEMQGEDSRLNDGGTNFLDQFVPMPEVKPGQTGAVTIRILPPALGAKLFQYNRTHKINNRSIHCPRPLVNGKWERKVACPICDYYTSIWSEIDKIEKDYGKDCPQAKALKAEAKELKPIERYYYNAIVRSLILDGKETKNVGPRILSVGKILHTMIIRAIVGNEGDPESKLGNIADLKNGIDFVIRKTLTLGDGYPKYDSSGFARNSSPAGTPEEIKSWAANLHDLTKLRNPREFEHLEKELAIHRGLIPDESDAFDTSSFDAKWGKKNGQEVEKAHVAVSSNVQADPYEEMLTAKQAAPKAASKKAEPAPAPKPSVQEETLEIEDEEFIRELEGMQE